ncbi:MAG TPA: ABC transporter permease, partial [Actinomadura sp.]|nr:ABC transporter permease [Actinomadura sp.]
MDLDADKQDLAHKGATATVELPGGRTVKGRIVSVGTVARQTGTQQDERTTVDVEISLGTRAPGASTRHRSPSSWRASATRGCCRCRSRPCWRGVKGQVRVQFLTESLLLSVLGGIAGAVLGAMATVAFAAYRHWPPVVPLWALGGGVAATLAIGTLAGLYPAMPAARLSPTV